MSSLKSKDSPETFGSKTQTPAEEGVREEIDDHDFMKSEQNLVCYVLKIL